MKNRELEGPTTEEFDADDYRIAGNALMLIFGTQGAKLYRVIINALAIAAYAAKKGREETPPEGSKT